MAETWMTEKEMYDVLKACCFLPHPHHHQGRCFLSNACFETPGRECSTVISPGAYIDCTDNVYIGAWCMIGAGTRIITHDHYHTGKKPLLLVQEEQGIWHSPLHIGNDVWVHGATVLAHVTEIPDGVVLGAGAVLTKNPGPYEIWAGVPAKKIGERRETDDQEKNQSEEKDCGHTVGAP